MVIPVAPQAKCFPDPRSKQPTRFNVFDVFDVRQKYLFSRK